MLKAQYEAVQSSRSALFEYCETLDPAHFVQETAGFGKGGSIRNLLVHNGTTYQYWIGEYSLSRTMSFPEYQSITNVAQCRTFFKQIDELMFGFLDHFKDDYYIELPSGKDEYTTVINPLKVFTHVITHEFHHKGQMLSISRILGYTPVDTDIIRN